jgi:hypothetical protein
VEPESGEGRGAFKAGPFLKKTLWFKIPENPGPQREAVRIDEIEKNYIQYLRRDTAVT